MRQRLKCYSGIRLGNSDASPQKLLMLKYEEWKPQREHHEWTLTTRAGIRANRDEGFLMGFTFPMCVLSPF